MKETLIQGLKTYLIMVDVYHTILIQKEVLSAILHQKLHQRLNHEYLQSNLSSG